MGRFKRNKGGKRVKQPSVSVNVHPQAIYTNPGSVEYIVVSKLILDWINHKPKSGKKEDIDCPKIAIDTGVKYQGVLSIFSHMLKHLRRDNNGEWFIERNI